ncbi:Hypothetical Protein U712_13840 [Bacillus subtilis PY79]|nr:Hypothetical Protein U712_13840 [Bacillus subtilis PY79]AKN14896.1 hypothetical protein ABU16_3820 [Bacillus subtilis]EME05681.1 hypothetical protein BS732_3358 [Bacillus subtilis MB73/2]KZD84527.1 hypothetical protein B4417_0602 [Bacillus subtilis]
MDILSSNWEYSILHMKKTAESFFDSAGAGCFYFNLFRMSEIK